MPMSPPRHTPYKHRPSRRVKETAAQSRERHGKRERNWLSTARWQRARAAFLAEYPLCRSCQARGDLVTATVVDHIEPHRHKDAELFWNQENWQPLCARCHNSKTGMGE